MYFTSIEQSKKLIELGIDPNTADMCYQYVKFDKDFNYKNAFGRVVKSSSDKNGYYLEGPWNVGW